MPILKIEAEFEGPASDLFGAMEDLARTFRHKNFQDLKALAPLNIQVISSADQPTHPLLPERIEELEFGVRTYNCLIRVGIETIGDLVGKSENDLMDIPNFGRRGVDEVIETLERHGLHLRES